MPSDNTVETAEETMVLEAFADTIIPGEKRGPDDHAVAGADTGGGAVAAGALELLRDPAGGLAPALTSLALELDEYAEKHAAEHHLDLPAELPPFVALPFAARTAVVEELTAPTHPDKQMWVGLALFCNMAFDSAPHRHTAEAVAEGHPGLRAMRFAAPDDDGLWRFGRASYGRQLAEPHPGTTTAGHPS